MSIESRKIEIEPHLLKLAQFELQEFIVPFRPIGRAVREQAERLDLCVGQFVGERDRNSVKAELTGGTQPQMAVNNRAIGSRANRYAKAEFTNGPGHTADRRIVIPARVARIFNEAVEWPFFDDQGHRFVPNSKKIALRNVFR